MTDKKAVRSLNVNLSPNDFDFPSASGLPDYKTQVELLQALANALPQPREFSEQGTKSQFAAALKLMEGLRPTGSAEAMLAAQMVAAHHAALECLRRAGLNNQPPQVRQQNLQSALKLMGLYTRQLEALDRRRGNASPRVTVESVRVESGGQAVVGVIDARSSCLPAPASAPSSLNAPLPLIGIEPPPSDLPEQPKPSTSPNELQLRRRRPRKRRQP